MALLDLFRRKPRRDAHQVALGAFGKHPGWDDFLATAQGVDTGLGIDTTALIELKRILQNEGILRFQEREEWKDLDREAWLEVFRHVFVWSSRGELVVGRLWSSFDRKGRRLPMFLAAQASGLALPWVARQFLPRLETIERRIRESDSSSQVESILDLEREQMRHLAAASGGGNASGSLMSLAELISHPGWGDDRTGLFRILYQVERDMAAYRGGIKTKSDSALLKAKGDDRQPQQLRVPVLGDDPVAEALAWLRMLRLELSPATPLLALIPLNRPHVDLVVGDPGAAAIHCVVGDVPLPSSVPYKLEPDFLEKTSQQLEAWKDAPEEEPMVSRKAPAPRRDSKSLGLIIAIGLLAVAAVALVVGLPMLFDGTTGGSRDDVAESPPPAGGRKGEWQEYTTAYTKWLGAFFDELSAETQRLERFRSDPDLRRWVVDLDGIRREHGGKIPYLGAGAADDPRASRLVKIHRSIRETLTSSGWKALGHVEKAAAGYAARGWAAEEKHLSALLAAVDPETSASLGAGIDGVLDAAPTVAAIEEDWRGIEEDQGALDGSGSPFLARFGENVAAWTRTEEDAVADIARLSKALGEIRALAGRLESFATTDWPRVVEDELPELLEQGPEEPTRQSYEVWLGDVADYVAIAADTGQEKERKSLERGIEASVSALAQLDPESGAADGFRRRFLEARMSRDEGRLPAILKNRDAILRREEGHLRTLRELRDEVRQRRALAGQSRTEWLASTEKLSTSSRALASAYRRRRDALLEGKKVGALDARTYVKLQTDVATLQEGLRALDRLPRLEGPEELAGREFFRNLQSAAEEKREASLGQALETPGLPRVPDIPDYAVPDYAAWLESVASLAQGFAGVEDRLGEFFLLDEAQGPGGETLRQIVTRWEKSPVFAEVREAVSPVRRRVQELATVRSLEERGELLRRTELDTSRETPEVIFASWLRLGELPEWPRDPGELATERRIRDTLKELVRRVESDARRRSLQEKLTLESKRRWLACFRRLEDDSDVRRAVTEMRAFAVELRDCAPASRLKVLLHQLRTSLARLEQPPGDADVVEQVQKFLDDVREAAPELEKEQRFAVFLAEIKDAVSSESAPPGDDAGPASSKLPGDWSPTRTEHGVTFTWRPAGGEHRMEFVLLASRDSRLRPTYLAATEVPLDLFIDVLESGGGWKIFEELNQKRWRGPRTWDWKPDRRVIETARTWLEEEKNEPRKRYYAEAVKPAAPTDRHPVQRISPAAALYFARLLGCRLPTPDEWRQAVVRLGETGATTSSNLRDLRWRKQKEYTERPENKGKIPGVQQRSLEYFRPRGLEGEGDALPDDDGFLWFAPVDSGGDALFLHLVGNVAEFTLSAPEELDALGDLTPATLRDFAVEESKKGRLRVIGGSALSPPILEPDKALPLRALEVRRHVGYSDVGLRLAFTAPSEPVALRLDRVLRERRPWPAKAAPK